MVPEHLLFMRVWGSHGYNPALPTSDVDFQAVYAAPTAHVLSMDKPPESVANSKPDPEAHEIAKFCPLLIKGNPTLLETLLIEKPYGASDEWVALQESRDRFLSSQAILQ
jgi:predicted nucleotidyltransferase